MSILKIQEVKDFYYIFLSNCPNISLYRRKNTLFSGVKAAACRQNSAGGSSPVPSSAGRKGRCGIVINIDIFDVVVVQSAYISCSLLLKQNIVDTHSDKISVPVLQHI